MNRRLVLLALVVLMFGCSRTDLAYRNADWLLERYAKKAVAADAGQLEHWQPVLHGVLEQHREEILPLITTFLERVEQAAASRTGSTDMECLVSGTQWLYERHAKLAADLTAPLLVELDPSQIDHLEDYAAQRLSKARRKYLKATPALQRETRVERVTERLEAWTGELSGMQEQKIRDRLAQMPDLSEEWLAYRAQKIDALVDMLETGSDEQALHAFLSRWWLYREGRSLEYARDWAAARQGLIGLLAQLAGSLSDRQRETLVDKIATIRKDLSQVSEKQPRPKSIPQRLACAPA